MYKVHNILSPLYLKQMFYISTVHTHNLRNSELNYYIPRPRTKYAKGSLHYKGTVLWNKIPFDIRHQHSLNNFKTALHGVDYNEFMLTFIAYFLNVVLVTSFGKQNLKIFRNKERQEACGCEACAR